MVDWIFEHRRVAPPPVGAVEVTVMGSRVIVVDDRPSGCFEALGCLVSLVILAVLALAAIGWHWSRTAWPPQNATWTTVTDRLDCQGGAYVLNGRTTRLLGWGPNHFDLADPGTGLVIRICRDGTSWYCSPAGGPWLAGPAGGWR
jgi:hypothetical protein